MVNVEGYHCENTEEGSHKRRSWSDVRVGIETGGRGGWWERGRRQSCGVPPDVIGKADAKAASIPEGVKGLVVDVEVPGGSPWRRKEDWDEVPGGSLLVARKHRCVKGDILERCCTSSNPRPWMGWGWKRAPGMF